MSLPVVAQALQAAHEASQQQPVRVQGSWNSPTVYVLLAIAGILGGILRIALKQSPVLAEIRNKRQNEVDEGLRADIGRMNERLAALERKLEESELRTDAANAKAHDLDKKLTAAVAAVTILSTELRGLNPNSVALQQASELIAAATTGDFGFGAKMNAIARDPDFKPRSAG